MTYEQGFARGEADAYRDRMMGLPLERFAAPTTEAARGYEDGYMPRSVTWWRPAKIEAMPYREAA